LSGDTWNECPYCNYSIPVGFAKCARNHPSPELVKQCHRDPPVGGYRLSRLTPWVKRTCRAIHGWNARTAITRFRLGLRSALVTIPSPELVKQCHRDPPVRGYRLSRLTPWVKRTCRAIHGWNARTAITRFRLGLRSALVTIPRPSSSNKVTGTRPSEGTACQD